MYTVRINRKGVFPWVYKVDKRSIDPIESRKKAMHIVDNTDLRESEKILSDMVDTNAPIQSVMRQMMSVRKTREQYETLVNNYALKDPIYMGLRRNEIAIDVDTYTEIQSLIQQGRLVLWAKD